jgi:LuxR family maltose regulon positive regulatory protein
MVHADHSRRARGAIYSGAMSPSAPSPWFAQAKIQPPHPRAATLVARPALEAGLVEHLMAQRVVLLHAAAGFGKSLLLARAVERLPGTCARVWLSLDEGDTLRSAGECLATALEPFDPPWRADPMSLAGAGEVHAAAAMFANTLLALEAQRGVLVLDDLHRVQDPGLVQFFAVLVERLTPGWCVAIASRSAPPFSLGRVAAQGELTVWREPTLALSHAECLQLCASLAPAAAEQVWERTAGWPAGVRLALTAASSGGSFAAAQLDRPVFEFFASEVIDTLPPDLRRFLLQISLLPQVTAAQAQAITQDANAPALFDEIERRALFAVDVGTDERTLRLHDLFKQALQRRLATEPGLDRHELLQRAALVEPDPARRIPLLVAAQAWHAAAAALAAFAPDALLAGAADDVDRLVQAFPAAQREVLPALLFVDGLVALARWQWARIPPLMKRAAALWREAGDSAGAHEADSLVPLALAGLGENRSARACLPSGGGPGLPTAAQLRHAVAESWILLAEGELAQAAACLARTVDILALHDAAPHLWQQAQPLPVFIGLPGAREPLQQWVQGALRRSPEPPTSLRGMAMVLRGWLQLRGGDGPGAGATCAEARSECLWLNQPEALAFQLGLLQAQLFALDERRDALDQHLRAMLAHASKAQDRQHRSASTGLLLYLGTRFASQSGHAALALELGQRLLKDADTVAGWIRADALSGIQAIVHECQGAAAPALAHWRQQLAMEGRSDLFGQAAEARLHGAALSATLEGRPQALALLTPLLQRCAAEGEPGLLRLASPSARQQLARHGLLAALPPAAAAGGVEAAAPVSAFAAAGLSSRELDVLSRLAAGHSNKLIAREFAVSPFTVKRHVGNILNKLDLASRGQAAAWYRDHGGR